MQASRKLKRDQARLENGTDDTNDEEIDPEELMSGAHGHRKNRVIDSRKAVPSHFFDENFDLAVPAMFYKCFYDGTPHGELSGKLDGYLELVERDLTDKLNKRSDAFLRALRDMQSLHLSVKASYRGLEGIRSNLKESDEELVVKSLEIVTKKTRKGNFLKVQKLMRLLQAVHRSVPNIEKLIEKEMYFEALETIRGAEHAMNNELRGASSLEGFQTKLDRMSKMIRGHLSAQFVDIACGYDVLLPEASDKIKPLVVEMQTIGQLISTLETYAEIQQQSIKRLVLECFTPISDNLNGTSLNSSSSGIQAPSTPLSARRDAIQRHSSASSVHDSILSPSAPMFNESEEHNMNIYETATQSQEMSDFLPKLKSILDELLAYVVRMKEVHTLVDQVFKDVDDREKRRIASLKEELDKQNANGGSESKNGNTSDGEDGASSSSNENTSTGVTREQIMALEEENQLQKRLRTQISIDSADIVFSGAELANTLIARLLRARSETHQRLPVQEFAEFYNVVANYVKSVDKQVGRPCPSLRAVLNTQARTMFADWDKRMCAKLSHTLNAEDWARAEIPPDFAAILQCLYTPKQSLHALDTTSHSDNVKTLTLGTERFTFVNSELIFAKLLYDYLIFLDILPSMYADVIAKIAEAINLWSKLTYGLVLKQGAVENQVVQGNINVGHLSLAANCLGVQLTLIPRIKERVLSYIQDATDISVLSSLDRATEECTTHQQEIYSKMITTMRNRVDACFKAYKVDEVTDKINPAVVKLMESTQKMHKILKTYLSPNTFKAIFRQIISAYNAQIKSHISALSVKTAKEKAKLLNDIHHILTELRALDGVEDPSDELVEFVHERFRA